MENKELFFKIFGAVIGVPAFLIAMYKIYNLFIRVKYKLDFSARQTLFAILVRSVSSELKEFPCIIFYDLGIVNNSTAPLTIKSLNLEYKHNGKVFLVDSVYINPGKVYDKSGKISPSIILTNKKEKIVLQDWTNIKDQLSTGFSIQQASVLKGSVIFTFDSGVTDFSKISELKLIVNDYMSNKVEFNINTEAFYEKTKTELFVIDRLFEKKADCENIEWID